VADLERVRDNVLDGLGEQAAALENLQSLDSYLMDVQLAARKTVSELEDADLSQVVIQLQAQETLLRLTLATAAQIMGPSLLDYIS
jgi:flagellar hook-associated protein 3 FlgL